MSTLLKFYCKAMIDCPKWVTLDTWLAENRDSAIWQATKSLDSGQANVGDSGA